MPKREPLASFTPAPLPVARLDDAERLACLRLIRSDNVGPVAFRELINHCGGASAALTALPELAKRGGRKRAIRICSSDTAERELDAARRIGAEPIFTIEPGYPRLLAALDAPPPLIYVKGLTELLNRPSLAIVGSRESSAAGIKLTQRFAHALADAGYVIVSGLARGIDRAAHEASIERGTVAVLAGGLDSIYPPEHAALFHRIASEGCLVSEQPPGFTPRAQDFPRRNRIISGLSHGVLIVEAAARSGTLVTARFAAEQGREVFAVPGHPLDPRAEGTNRLLKNGATIATTPEDVIEVLTPMAGFQDASQALPPDRAERFARAHATPEPALPQPMAADDALATVAAALGPQPCDLDALLQATRLPVRVVQVALMELDLAGRLSRPGPGLIALNAAEPE
ncbi:MAG: DNA-processing protein DprA [Hyphomicrobium sp.]